MNHAGGTSLRQESVHSDFNKQQLGIGKRKNRSNFSSIKCRDFLPFLIQDVLEELKLPEV